MVVRRCYSRRSHRALSAGVQGSLLRQPVVARRLYKLHAELQKRVLAYVHYVGRKHAAAQRGRLIQNRVIGDLFACKGDAILD